MLAEAWGGQGVQEEPQAVLASLAATVAQRLDRCLGQSRKVVAIKCPQPASQLDVLWVTWVELG